MSNIIVFFTLEKKRSKIINPGKLFFLNYLDPLENVEIIFTILCSHRRRY